jgi:hypothetical protein
MFRKIFIISIIYFLHSNPVFSEEMDFNAYRMLDLGASESDVIKRAGPPDKTVIFYGSYDNSNDLKQFLYIPSSRSIDPHLTIITLLHRIIIKLEREQARVPSVNAIPGQMPYYIYSSLRIGMSEGELLARSGFPAREYQPNPEKDIKGRTVLVSEFVYEAAPEDIDPQFTYIYLKEGKISEMKQCPPINGSC